MRYISIHLSQAEINSAMRPLIERKLHEEGANVIEGGTRVNRYFMVLVDPPAVAGAVYIYHRVDRDNGDIKLMYRIKD